MMVSIDRGLLGGPMLGDVVQRHRAYGAQRGVEQLDIVVFSLRGYAVSSLSRNVTAYPTNSVAKLLYLTDAIRLGERLAAAQPYDLLVAQDPFLTGLVGAHLKRRRGGKLLVHCHGDFFGNPYWRAEAWWHRWFLKVAQSVVRQADGLRVVSLGIAAKLQRLGVPSQKIRVIPTPVDVGKFQASAAAVAAFRAQHQIPAGGVILNVGRDDPSKDYPTLWRTLQELGRDALQPVTLLQVGASLQLDELRRQHGVLPPAVRLVAFGQLPQAELPAAYAAASVYLSTSRHESFGKVLVEANAAGLPLVATATTGSEAIIQPGVNGFLVPVGDARQLAARTNQLLHDRELARAMGERGRQLVAERFDGFRTTAAIVQFWHDLVTHQPVVAAPIK